MLCFSALLLFLSSVNTLASSLGEKEPFPGPSLKGREMGTVSSSSPKGKGYSELSPCVGLREPFPSPSLKGREMEPFFRSSLKGREMRAFSSPSPSGEGWGEALINEISDSADYTVP